MREKYLTYGLAKIPIPSDFSDKLGCNDLFQKQG